MTTGTGGTVRKFFTRSVAASILLAMYCMGTIAVTGGLLTATTTSAEAYWRRGWRGRGWRGRGVWRRGWRGRGWRGRGVWRR